MFKRTDKGGLSFNTLDMSIMFDDLFDIAKNEDEIDFIYDSLISYIETAREDKVDSLD